MKIDPKNKNYAIHIVEVIQAQINRYFDYIKRRIENKNEVPD